jgi:hypothetical protein
MAVLLQQDSFNALLQDLTAPIAAGEPRKPSTCNEYMWLVRSILKLPEVQQLLNPQQLQQQGEA